MRRKEAGACIVVLQPIFAAPAKSYRAHKDQQQMACYPDNGATAKEALTA